MTKRLVGVATLVLLFGCAHESPSVGESHQSPQASLATVRSTNGGPSLPKPSGANLDGNPNVALGIPLDADPSDDYLINRTYWVASYSPKRLEPNWVSWRLVASDLGSVKRGDSFRADTGLPDGFKKVQKTDYAGSRYDRGHMCPSADRTSTEEANGATFLMTNMQPQVSELNRGPWKVLEDYERSLARQGKELQIVAGGIFKAEPTTVGPGVEVPTANFKIIVVLEPGQGATDVSNSTLVYAIIIPNAAEVRGTKWFQYMVSVDEVERQTGYDFLRDVPDDVENVIEARVATPPGLR